MTYSDINPGIGRLTGSPPRGQAYEIMDSGGCYKIGRRVYRDELPFEYKEMCNRRHRWFALCRVYPEERWYCPLCFDGRPMRDGNYCRRCLERLHTVYGLTSA